MSSSGTLPLFDDPQGFADKLLGGLGIDGLSKNICDALGLGRYSEPEGVEEAIEKCQIRLSQLKEMRSQGFKTVAAYNKYQRAKDVVMKHDTQKDEADIVEEPATETSEGSEPAKGDCPGCSKK